METGLRFARNWIGPLGLKRVKQVGRCKMPCGIIALRQQVNRKGSKEDSAKGTNKYCPIVRAVDITNPEWNARASACECAAHVDHDVRGRRLVYPARVRKTDPIIVCPVAETRRSTVDELAANGRSTDSSDFLRKSSFYVRVELAPKTVYWKSSARNSPRDSEISEWRSCIPS